ncbi:MAG: ATP-binding protein [Deltaproteobacteria bacterium]|jgi:hypothetical protein|nr:ATP-binding protein [Deltaproteobacteria bacterium]
MKELPLAAMTFADLIASNFIYSDKTEYLYKLVRYPLPYFLSRPRRFGKSMLVSTLKEIFLGHRDLFTGLWIDRESDYDWSPYPVIHLDMHLVRSVSPKALYESILSNLKAINTAEALDVTDKNPVDFFSNIIKNLNIKYNKAVVVLIDEYDYPILNNISDNTLANDIRKALKEFYGILKSSDGSFRFIFITGVTRFTKTSIFSDFNHLIDITLERDFSNICGFTIEEFDSLFPDHLERALKILKNEGVWGQDSTVSELRQEILDWYDGYSWDGQTRVLNPWSVLNFFRKVDFNNFWFESGTPSFLVNLITDRKVNLNLLDHENTIITDTLNNVDIGKFEPIPVMFQTGYLTVDKVETKRGESLKYFLVVPNLEVKASFFSNLLSLDISLSDPLELKIKSEAILLAITQKNSQKLEDSFHQFLASIDNKLHIPLERFYQTTFMFAMTLANQSVKTEVSTGDGYIDIVLKISKTELFIIKMKYIKIIEDEQDINSSQLELNRSSDKPKAKAKSDEEINHLMNIKAIEALKQIDKKNYISKYLVLGLSITKVVLIVYEMTKIHAIFDKINSIM